MKWKSDTNTNLKISNTTIKIIWILQGPVIFHVESGDTVIFLR